MSKCNCLGVGVQIDNLAPNTSNIQLCTCIKSEMADLRAELQRVELKLKEVGSNRDYFKGEFHFYHAACSNQDKEIDRLREVNEKLKSSLSERQGRVHELNEKCDRLQARCNSLELSASEWKQDADRLREQLRCVIQAVQDHAESGCIENSHALSEKIEEIDQLCGDGENPSVHICHEAPEPETRIERMAVCPFCGEKLK